MNNALSHLPERSASLGVLGNYLAFGDGNLRVWDWQHTATLLEGDARAAWKFLLLQGRLGRKDADRLFGQATVEALVGAGLAKQGRSGVSLGKAVFLNYQQQSFFAELSTEPRALFSEDAKAIVAALPTLDYRRCLSIYSGCGIETLVLNHRAGCEVVYLNPEADPRFLDAGWQMNRIEASFRIAKEKRLRPKDQFDLVLARIPSWSLPEDLAGVMFCPGGATGMAEIEHCFELVGRRLEPDGNCCFTCILYGGDTFQPSWDQMTALADRQGLKLAGLCSSKQLMEPGIPLFNHLFGFLESRTGRPPREILEKLVNHFGNQRISTAYFVRGRAVRGSGPHSLVDLSDRYYGNWNI